MQPISITASKKSIRIYTPDGYKTFRIAGLQNSLRKIYSKSVELTKQWHSTPKFPEFLGADKRAPIFISEDVNIINNVLAGFTDSYSPETVYTAAARLKDIARNNASFEREFYGTIADYYGKPKLTVKQTKSALKNKLFKSPRQDYANGGVRNSPERYERKVEWMLNQYRNISYSKIVNLSNAELNEIIQTYDTTELQTGKGYIPSKYTQSYARKNKVTISDSNRAKGTTPQITDPVIRPRRLTP